MDLSHLPPALREKLESHLARMPAPLRASLGARLAKLPADQVQAAIDKTAPLLQRLVDKSEGRTTRSGERAPDNAQASKGHYNTTVQRGDRALPSMGLVLFLLAGVLAVLWSLGWLTL
jgi:hypothetical protein